MLAWRSRRILRSFIERLCEPSTARVTSMRRRGSGGVNH